MGVIAINLSKAFDCICHTLLLAKVKAYGVQGPALQLFRSYLQAASKEKERQFELMFEQQQAMLQAMQQQQQNQSLQLIMVQQNQVMMSLIGKMISKD